MCSGCKFTAEEERLVIELQAQYGNKWAKIATYLQGRTDNDVKNFWSSRRKRLERMLQKPPASKPKKNKGKAHLNQVQQVEEMVRFMSILILLQDILCVSASVYTFYTLYQKTISNRNTTKFSFLYLIPSQSLGESLQLSGSYKGEEKMDLVFCNHWMKIG